MAITLNGTTGVTTTGLTSNGIDDNATSTAMTLDTSGNLLVGTTNNATWETTAGHVIRPNSSYTATRDGAHALIVNRLTSDGDIVQFAKNGTTVGSIGTAGGTLTIDGGGTSSGIYFGENQLVPRDNGAGSNNVVDLGQSGNSFKDLYLSGGVYLGGTGAANKLDDYEEGTWTPVDDSGASLTFASVVGPTYTKIGRMVIVNVELTFPTTSNTNRVFVGGFPFVVASPSAHGGFIRYSNQSDRPHILANPASTKMVLYSQAGGLFSNNQLSGKRFDFTVIYHTTE